MGAIHLHEVWLGCMETMETEPDCRRGQVTQPEPLRTDGSSTKETVYKSTIDGGLVSLPVHFLMLLKSPKGWKGGRGRPIV